MTKYEAKEYLKNLQESDYIKDSLLVDEYNHALAMAIQSLENTENPNKSKILLRDIATEVIES